MQKLQSSKGLQMNLNSENNAHKKAYELFQISTLLEKEGLCESKRLDWSESPDFLLDNHGKIIAIEVTSCHSLKIETQGRLCVAESEKCLYEILNEYKNLLIARGEKSKCIDVTFSDHIYKVHNLKKIKRDIFREIDTWLDYHKGGYGQDCIYVADAHEYPYVFDRVDVFMSGAYWGTPVNIEHIMHCIKEKDSLLPQYKIRTQKFDIKEFWLVIDFIQDWDTDIRGAKISCTNTNYDRIYLTKYGDLERIK